MCCRFAPIIAFTAVAMVASVTTQSAEINLTVDRIFGVWQEREATMPFVEGTCLSSVTATPDESESEDHESLQEMQDMPVNLFLAGSSFRKDVLGSIDTAESFESGTARSMYGGGGMIKSANTEEQLRRIEDMGFLWFFRPSLLGARKSRDWRMDSRIASIAGVECVVLVRSYSSNVKDILYVQATAPFLPMRYEHNSHGRVWGSVTTEYAMNEAGLLLPSLWHWREASGYGTCSDAVFKLVESIPASRFHNIFRPGMRVVDARNGGNAGDQSLFVQDDGSLAPGSEELPFSSNPSWLFVAFGLAILSFLVVRQIRKSRSGT